MALSDAEQSIVDGSAWNEFCDQLKKAGEIITRDGTPTDPFNRAEGFRYLTRILRNALETTLEAPPPSFPKLRSVNDSGTKIGADNPDNYYQGASLKPDYDYKIKGYRGTVDYLGFGSQKGGYGSSGGLEPCGYIDARDMEIDEDGYFELVISKREHPGNWLKMEDGVSMVIVRQTFKDRKTENRAELTIERIGAEGAPPPLTAERVARALQQAAMNVQGIVGVFTDWSDSMAHSMNELPQFNQQECIDLGGDPNIHYFHSQWSLADDEVLIIEADDIPECQTWNFQLDNYWMESLDYENHTIHVNAFTAKYREDGGVTLVVSHKDPGVPNWIDTCSHNMGTMCWRWIGADRHPDLKTRVAKFSEVAK